MAFNYHKKPLSHLPYNLKRQMWRLSNRWERNKFDVLRYDGDEDYCLRPFDDLNCIFIHIPKAAGISICRALFGNLGGGHTTIRKYELIYPKSDFDQRFKFTVVRNPWDRVVSAFYFLKEGGFGDEDPQWIDKHINSHKDFESFVINELASEAVQEKLHFKPQILFLQNDRGEIPVDFIGKFENLNGDLATISKHLGIEANLDHNNKTQGRKDKSYRDYYNKKTKGIIKEIYQIDIKYFEYDF